jgi:lipopolysaccharide/colanic/teichoic acid biosynthesis glycosyltransferase
MTATDEPLVGRGGHGEPHEWRIQQPTAAQTRWRTGKRAFDIALSLTLLVAILPLLLLIALAIKLDSRGPVLYRVRRVGYRGRPLMMLKFRKMHNDATGGPLTLGGDARLTRVGRVLTKLRFDELPQLWDVLRGRMSVIGPRPEDPVFVDLHLDDYKFILSVRPGITGLSQLAYAEERRIIDDQDPIDDYIGRVMPQKLTLDTLYASRLNLRMDLLIIGWTIVTVLLRRPIAVNRLTGEMNIRRRPKVTAQAAKPIVKSTANQVSQDAES